MEDYFEHMNTPMIKNIRKFVMISKMFKQLFNNTKLSWQDKYHLVFQAENSIKKSLDKTGIVVEWVDYDTSYQEDVKQYYDAVQLKADDFREFLIEAEMNRE